LVSSLYPTFEAWLDERLFDFECHLGELLPHERQSHDAHFRAQVRRVTPDTAFLPRDGRRPVEWVDVHDDDVFGCLLQRYGRRDAEPQLHSDVVPSMRPIEALGYLDGHVKAS
jgi:hypothetical protein